ncbi:uncharacterized protein LOC113229738 [Hyposmocoma kahamanoa]|uniref:uncharacterized protein LOC113229738 n=1 Tax=Hyposmocoma kahamanoa TaxID=1477025 RepID=UPI000E6D9395|nr:uncharacterized protein LOC113229738 [Hyposmocoma kahamanoa]
MSNLGGILILAKVLEVIHAQPPANIPEICLGSAPYLEPAPNCCDMPPLFSVKDMYKCGFPEPDSVLANKHVTSRDCPKFKCLAKVYNVLRDGEVDSELLYTLMNNYVKENPSFKSAIASAKKTCVGKQLTGMESCPPEKIFACIFSIMLFECPGWQTDPRCAYMKDFMKICPPYLFKF